MRTSVRFARWQVEIDSLEGFEVWLDWYVCFYFSTGHQLLLLSYLNCTKQYHFWSDEGTRATLRSTENVTKQGTLRKRRYSTSYVLCSGYTGATSALLSLLFLLFSNGLRTIPHNACVRHYTVSRYWHRCFVLSSSESWI